VRAGGAARRRESGPTDDVGKALRTVFEQTVDEDIPSEMLDLLNKLA
jgi:hypothetical protein